MWQMQKGKKDKVIIFPPHLWIFVSHGYFISLCSVYSFLSTFLSFNSMS